MKRASIPHVLVDKGRFNLSFENAKNSSVFVNELLVSPYYPTLPFKTLHSSLAVVLIDHYCAFAVVYAIGNDNEYHFLVKSITNCVVVFTY